MTDNERVADGKSEPKGAAPDDASAALKAWLIDLLVCPVDRAAVTLDGSELLCNRCGRRYPVQAGIPNMLPDHAKIEH